MSRIFNFKLLALVVLMFVININGAWALTPAVGATITVKFDMQGHGTQVEQQQFLSGNTATEPSPTPMESGFEFRAWYKEPACINRFDFKKAVTATQDSTITLYAKWRDLSTWDEFQKKLNEYSYVEYYDTLKAKSSGWGFSSVGFKLHFATGPDEAVSEPATFSDEVIKQSLQFLPLEVEISQSVANEYNLNMTLITTWTSLYPQLIDELQKCLSNFGEDVTNQSKYIFANVEMPYRAKGIFNALNPFSVPAELYLNTWVKTNFGPDVDFCKCMLNSDVILKANAKLIEAWQTCEK